jgi:hypothetical protein
MKTATLVVLALLIAGGAGFFFYQRQQARNGYLARIGQSLREAHELSSATERGLSKSELFDKLSSAKYSWEHARFSAGYDASVDDGMIEEVNKSFVCWEGAMAVWTVKEQFENTSDLSQSMWTHVVTKVMPAVGNDNFSKLRKTIEDSGLNMYSGEGAKQVISLCLTLASSHLSSGDSKYQDSAK